MKIRAFRKHVHVYDAGNTHWRGGVVWAIAGASATLHIRVEAHMQHLFTMSTASLPHALVGAPVVVRVTGNFPYTIAEIRDSHFASGDGDDQLGKIARNELFPAVVPRVITGENDILWEA